MPDPVPPPREWHTWKPAQRMFTHSPGAHLLCMLFRRADAVCILCLGHRGCKRQGALEMHQGAQDTPH